MNESIYTAIDIGSKNIKIISIFYDQELNKTKILHKNSYTTRGITDGYISNPELFHQSFSEALLKYKKETGITVKEAVFTISSSALKAKTLKINHQTVNQSTVTDVDVNEIKRKINLFAEKNIPGKILDSKLINYKINNYKYFSEIEGMESKKIEAEYIFIFLPQNHLSTLEKILLKNDISILNIFSANVVSAEINIEKEDRDLGVLNIDMGADITSFSIWENDRLLFLDSIKYGSDDITKKISMENKIAFSEAEILKKNWNKNPKIEKLIKKLFSDLAKSIKRELVELEKNELLPAGAIVYGGGAKNELFKDVFKNELSMPVKKYSKNISDSKTDYYNPYAGVIMYILNEKNNNNLKFPPIFKWIKKRIFKLSLD